jgi:signal transduction histidine kinase
MNLHSSPHSRAERLIATGRVVLAAFSLLAIGLEPSGPARHAQWAYALLSGYGVYALLVALLVWSWHAPPGRLPLITHVLDMAAFSLLMDFTGGPASPFFIYFVFSLVCATVRWQWRGTLWTALGTLAAFVGLSVYAVGVLGDPTFEPSRFIIRSAHLAVVAALLGYLGAYEQRLRSEMTKLAAWPQTVPRDAHVLVRELLEHAAGLLGASRVLMGWEEPEEPWFHLALLSRGEFQWTREPPATFEPLVAEPLAGTDFLCPDARPPVPLCLHASSDGLQHWHGAPLHSHFQSRFAIGPVLALRLHGQAVKGRLFCLDKPGMTSDDLVLGEIVGRQVTARMDHFYLLQRLQQSAVMEERIRLARELHDGVLQSLTGAALQLQTIRRLFEWDQQAAQDRLLEIQRLIADEQRDLRFFIQELKPAAVSPSEQDSSLAARLDELGERFERYWGLRVELRLERAEARIPQALVREIYRIVHEALVNAARHAHASTARVELGVQSNQVRITVADNGRGFRFHGYFDHATLTDMKLGPVMLKERIASLGGSLAIDSTESGARLEISLPLQPGAENAH